MFFETIIVPFMDQLSGRKSIHWNKSECMPIVTNVPKFTVVTQFDLIQSS